MQNRYVGDLGDFGKFGLLKALRGEPADLRLGVVWYLNNPREDNADGKHVRYLSNNKDAAQFTDCDSRLYSVLGEVVATKQRSVQVLRERRVLGEGVTFFEKLVPEDGSLRAPWVDEALHATEASDVVFLDPDNGLAPKSVPMTSPDAKKYVYLREISEFLGREQSVVVYHHLGRLTKADEQIRTQIEVIDRDLRPSGGTIGVSYHRGTARAYFILMARHHEDRLRSRIDRFLAGPWSKHFSEP